MAWGARNWISTQELLSPDLLDVLKQVQELNPEKSDPQPQQRLIWRGGGGTLTEAVLKAVEASALPAFNDSTLFFSKRPVRLHTQMKACASEATLKADSEILVKGKLALDQTVLPPLLRIFAATCLPALTTALSDVAKQVEGAVVVASEEGSVKTAERMVEAMKSEIAKKHQAEEGAGWQPVSALVRDALRATVVCPGAQAMCDVKAAFDASPSAQTKALRRVC